MNKISIYVPLVILSVGAFIFLLCHYSPAETVSRNAGAVVYHIPVNGDIDLGLVPFIKRVIQDADQQKAEAIILEINTFGGRLDAAVEIRDALIKTKTLTIAFINDRAISAGALIALACQKIVMSPAATIGAATPVTINPLTREVGAASEKVVSYFRKEMKATAERNGRPTIIAEAMVDADVVIEGLTEKGKLLTLTTSEAIQSKLADSEVSEGIQGVLAAFHLAHCHIITQRPGLTEKFLRIISESLISSLLLVLGIFGLFLAFRTPTWGVTGTIGLLCILLFLWGHWVLNLVGWEEILLIFIGIVLLLIEIFVIPGFGIVGILGILFLTIGLILSLLGRHPTINDIWSAVSHVSIVCICVAILSLLFFKTFSKSKAMQRFVLHSQARESIDTHYPPRQEGKEYAQGSLRVHYFGKEGIAYTNLRPAGKGIFGKERLNVVTEGDFLDKGTPIRIISAEGPHLIVQRIKENKAV